jgi:glycerophosphoryl diester phosphodiesterase
MKGHKHVIPEIVAHRGLHDQFPENSLQAFAAARAAGFAWIECDVHLTADGVPIVMHDETLDRTTNGRGLIREQTWDDISRLTLRSASGKTDLAWRVPQLSQISPPVMVEIKPPDDRRLVQMAVEIMSTHGMPWILQSFDARNLHHAAATSPRPRVAALVEDAQWFDFILEQVFHAYYIDHQILTAEMVEALETKRREWGAWTVNEPRELRRVLQWRPDRIITDHPELVRTLAHEWSQQSS